MKRRKESWQKNFLNFLYMQKMSFCSISTYGFILKRSYSLWKGGHVDENMNSTKTEELNLIYLFHKIGCTSFQFIVNIYSNNELNLHKIYPLEIQHISKKESKDPKPMSCTNLRTQQKCKCTKCSNAECRNTMPNMNVIL